MAKRTMPRTSVTHRNRARKAALVRCCMEPLESRWLLSGSVLQWGGGLTGNALYSTETTLTPTNVNSSQFEMLSKISLPGGSGDQVYAQPLYVENLTITGQGTNNGVHNVVIVATEENNVYAYDTSTDVLLWKINLGPDIPHATYPAGGPNFANFSGTMGVTGTPVIDPNTDLMYLDSAQIVGSGSTASFDHKIFSINITNGATVSSFTLGNAVTGGFDPQVAGNTADAVNGTITFSAGSQLQRPGLTILNGVVYIGYGSYGNFDPYHGWVMGFSENSLSLVAVYNDVPNEIPGQPNLAARAEGSIWQSGAEITTDGTSLFIVSGNGIFDSAVDDFGESAIRLTPTLTTASSETATGYGLAVADYFAPSNANVLGPFQTDGDLDLGTSGAMLLPTQPGSVPNEELLVSKEGVAYLLNMDDLGGNNPTDEIVQELSLNGHGMWGNPTYFDGNVYFHAQGDVMEEYTLSAASATSPAILSLEPIAGSTVTIASEGATPVISSNGNTNGVIWEISNTGSLNAYNASTLQEVYTNSPGTVEHFSVPVVADGQVYVAGAGFLAIYGEKPNPFTADPAAPTSPAISNTIGDQLTVSWSGSAVTNEQNFLVERSVNNSLNFMQVASLAIDATSYVDTSVTPGSTYYYRIRAANTAGDSAYTTAVNASAQMYTTPVDLYHFDDSPSSTTAADSGTSNITGTLTGSTLPQFVPGYNGGAISFSGNGVYNSNATQSALQVTTSGLSSTLNNNATVDVWIKTTQVGNNNPDFAPALFGVTELNGSITFPPTAANTQDADNDLRWFYINGEGQIGIAVDGYKAVPNLASAGPNDPGDTYGVTSTQAINDGQWHNVAISRNTVTGLLQVYVDGVLQASFLGDTGAKSANFNLIGAQIEEQSNGAVSGRNYFNGEIDDLRVYNQILNSTEIGLLASMPGSPTNLGAVPASGTSAQLEWTFTPVPGTLGVTPNVQIDYRIGTSGAFSPLLAVSGTLSSYTVTGLTAGTQYQFEIQEIDNAGSSDFTTPAGVIPVFASIAGRNIFYNDSVFDGFDSAADSSDAAAFATDKTALLPGETATFANYTSYVDGINGIAIDISNDFGTVTPADFTFSTGNSSNPSSWTAANAPDSMVIMPGQGAGGSTRIEFVWTNDDAVTNAWLQVTVSADTDTNLQSPDVFYFGNAVGETGDSATDANVDATDQIGVRANNASGVSVTNPYDFNRDGNVDSTDEAIARNNQTNFTNALQLITVPEAMDLLPALQPAETSGSSGAAPSATAITAGLGLLQIVPAGPVSHSITPQLIIPLTPAPSTLPPAPAINLKPLSAAAVIPPSQPPKPVPSTPQSASVTPLIPSHSQPATRGNLLDGISRLFSFVRSRFG